jgi:cysteine dioxygenase
MVPTLSSTEKQHETCHSLNELISSLSEEDSSKYTDIIRTMEIPTSAFKDCCSWSDDCYTRNCLAQNDKYELILLCWEKGQVTPIHDHGGEECWVRIIEGEFKEKIYKVDETGSLKAVKSAISKTGDITYMVDFMGCHSLENLSDTRSMSLHLYAKPIRNCNAFDEALGKFVNKDLEYTTVFNIEKNI